MFPLPFSSDKEVDGVVFENLKREKHQTLAPALFFKSKFKGERASSNEHLMALAFRLSSSKGSVLETGANLASRAFFFASSSEATDETLAGSPNLNNKR